MNAAKHIATRLARRIALASVLSLLPALGAQAALPMGNTRGDNVVMIDDKTGAYLGDFIAAGSSGQTDPDDVTLGPDGKVCVSSGSNATGSILRYSSSGTFIDTVATGSGLKRPYGNAFGPDGNLSVASFRSDQILRYSGSTGAFIDVFAQGNGTSTGLLNGPNDLVFALDGMLYVIINCSTPIDDGHLQLCQWLFRNDTEADCPEALLIHFDDVITREDKAILESTDPDAVIDVRRRGVEFSMESDKPGMMIRKRLLELLTAHGEAEVHRGNTVIPIKATA